MVFFADLHQPSKKSRILRLAALFRTLSGCFGMVLVGGFFQTAGGQSLNPVPAHASAQRAILDRYCVVCHNEQALTAGLALDKMDVERINEGAAVWEKVLRKLRGRAMPPAGMPRPDEATYDAFADYLERELDGAEPNPGRPVLLVSTVLNTATPSAICWRWRSMEHHFFPPMIPAMASTISGMCSPYPLCCWKDT